MNKNLTPEEIKEVIAKEYGCTNWLGLTHGEPQSRLDILYNKVTDRYAKQFQPLLELTEEERAVIDKIEWPITINTNLSELHETELFHLDDLTVKLLNATFAK